MGGVSHAEPKHNIKTLFYKQGNTSKCIFLLPCDNVETEDLQIDFWCSFLTHNLSTIAFLSVKILSMTPS